MNTTDGGKMSWFGRMTILFVGVIVVMTVRAEGQVSSPGERKLVVGTKEAPPFAIKNADSTWSGLSIELWKAIADELQLEYEFREFDLKGLLEGVRNKSLDAAVAALTITAEREKSFDFTHSFYTTGFGIAVAPQGMRRWLGMLKGLLSWEVLEIIGGLVLLLGIIGSGVYLFERKRNPQQFGGRVLQGIGAGFWWAAVTLTTVGYGDKAPITLGGRLIALIWMFAGILFLSGFIATITTTLTVTQLQSFIRGPEDLTRVWVATVADSTSESYLRENRIRYRSYETVREGLQAVARGEVDAMVYDAPLLLYLANTELQGVIEVLPQTFERQEYGIALPQGSLLREPINRVLLAKIATPAWKDLLFQYLGEAP